MRARYWVLATLWACDATQSKPDGSTDSASCASPIEGFTDADGDGFGDPTAPVSACEAPPSLVDNASDCDDSNAHIHPNAPEVCNGLDDDCDGLLDDEDDSVEGLVERTIDADGDGDGDRGAAVVAVCPGPGWSETATDCDDANPNRAPALTEVCDDAGVDEDCDDTVDCADSDCDGSCPEDCTDGRDNDGNGLLDCEDAVCMEHPSCMEVLDECNDGRDNDRDGMADCEDDDCWQLGVCARTTFVLEGADLLEHSEQYHFYSHFGTGPTQNSTYAEDRLVFGGLTGHLRLYTLSGSSSCGFSLDSGRLRYRAGRVNTRNYHSSSAQGSFALDSDCDSPLLQAHLPGLANDFASSQGGKILHTTGGAPLLRATGWTSTFQSNQDSTTYFGTTGYGGPASYGRWWNTSTTKHTPSMLELADPIEGPVFHLGE